MSEGKRSLRRRPAGGLRNATPWMLAAASSFGVALFGTLTGWSVAVTGALLALVALFAAYATRREAVDFGEAHAAVAAITLFTALQCVPFPAALLEIVSPLSLDDARDTARALGDDVPFFGTLSRSPTDTLRELLKACVICSSFFAATIIVRLSSRRAVVLAGSAAALTAGILTVGHVIADADRVWGIYEYPWPPYLMGPIGNQNNLSGFMAMVVPPLLGAALESQDRTRRALFLAAATFAGVMALASISRGGTVSLVVGLFVFGALVAFRAQRSADRATFRRSMLALIGLSTLVSLLALAAYGLADELAVDFGASSTGKLEAASEGLVLLSESPWLGVGRGAFRVAYTHLVGTDRMFYPENLLVQWLTEWGVPATLLLLVSLGSAWLRAARKAESTVQIGALAGIAAMVLHDQVDFALENLAIACSAAILFAGAIAKTARGSDAVRSPTRRDRIAVIGPGVAAATAALCLGWYVHQTEARRLEHALLALSAEEEWTEVDALGRTAMRWHPSEPVFPLILGWAAAARDARDAPRWLNRAMALAPDWPSPHLITARWLARRGRLSQAWLEVREAERVRADAAIREICIFAGLTTDPAVLEGVFAGQPMRDRVLSTAAACPGAPENVADALDRVLIEGTPVPVQTEARVRLARRSLVDGDIAAALAWLDHADPRAWTVRFARADILSAAHRTSEAIAILEAHGPIEVEPQRLEALARAHAAAGNDDAMRAAMEEVRRYAAGSGPRLAATALLLGRLEEQLGNSGRAYQAYDDAHRLDPTGAALAATAALAASEGDLRRAYLALSAICRDRGPASPECAAAEAARERSE